MKSSGTFSKQAHVNIPDGLFEEEHGRKGFFGRVSQIYHKNPPTNWSLIEGDLRPENLPNCFEKPEMSEQFQVILFNDDVQISLANIKKSTKHFFRNADFDELFFIQQGVGVFETIYGPLSYSTGDYIIIPRGTTYRIVTKDNSCHILKVESKSEFEQPNRGLLGPNALYDQTMITIPQITDLAKNSDNDDQSTYQVHIKRLGKISKITYPFNPLDAMGWKGDLYPWKLSIYDICPIMSHRYHIPPSGHTTFVAGNFVVCSFVARPLEDSSHGVLKVPFYHSNIDYDEVIFYHKGDFFSRDNIEKGAITFHPQGIHHGPHPKAFASANTKTYTDEFAVMVDTKFPLKKTTFFEKYENKDYWKSWM